MSEAVLVDLQADIAQRALNDSYFTDITVLTDRHGDILSDINNALGTLTTKSGLVGVCAIVLQPLGTVELSDVPGAIMEIRIAVRVLENVIINTAAGGTGKPALAVARRLARLIHHYTPKNLAQTFICDKPTIVPVQDPLAPVAYEVRFITQESDPDLYTKVDFPFMSPNGGASPQTVTLTCATSGASIRYTTDGTHPTTSSTLYTAPFAVNSALALKVSAFKSGLIESDMNFSQFT